MIYAALIIAGLLIGAVSVQLILPQLTWLAKTLAALALPVLFLLLRAKFEALSVVLYFALFFTLFYVAVLWDFREKIIPDWISVGGTIAGIPLSIWIMNYGWPIPVLGILIAGGLMLVIALLRSGKWQLGGGDIKLAAMMGAFLGHQPALTSILISAALGFLTGAVLISTGRLSKDAAVPYGPFLFLGSVFGVFIF